MAEALIIADRPPVCALLHVIVEQEGHAGLDVPNSRPPWRCSESNRRTLAGPTLSCRIQTASKSLPDIIRDELYQAAGTAS